MQDRYAGDVGDFIKFALLRALAPDRRTGVGWYLTPDESHNGDGRHIGYLRDPDRWRHYDPDLFDRLIEVVDSEARSVAALEAAALLPDAVFHSDRLTTSAGRETWFASLLDAVSECDLVFLDPDNGLQPDGFRAGSAKSRKSITYDEVSGLRGEGRTLLVYHHQTRRAGGHDAEIRYLADRLRSAGARNVSALRARPYSPRVFFLIDACDTLIDRAQSFATEWTGLVSFRGDRQLAP